MPTTPFATLLERAPRAARDGLDDAAARASDLRLALFTDTYPPQLNGVSRTLERLVRAIEARGGAARVYTTTDPGVQQQDARDTAVWRRASIPFWAYPQLRLVAPTRGRAVADLRAWQPTLIHAATPFGMGLTGRRCARELGVPLVTSYHTSFNEYAKFYHLGALSEPGWAYIRWFHNSGVRTFVPTHSVRRALQEKGFRHLRVWGRGVETDRFNPAFRSAAWRARLGADADTIIAAYVGRLAAEKGLDTILAAMQRAASRPPGQRPRIIFAFAGDGPYAAQCRAAAPPPPLAQFVGRLEGRELSEFFASADVFLFPSTTDTFGNVLLEAMASGLPVIAAESGPTRELLECGGGVLVPARDADALLAKIDTLAADPACRATLAARGAAFAAECTWDRIFDELIGEMREVAVRSGREEAYGRA